MTTRGKYVPGPAAGARIEKDGDTWTLVLVRSLRHPPDTVWQALTDPAHLREWAPFDADARLDQTGRAVMLTTVGAPRKHPDPGAAQASETTVKEVNKPHVLVYSWGGSDIRWELEAVGDGTRLTLWHSIDRRFIAMGAAGWHVCFDVMERLLDGSPVGRIVAGDALQFEGWQRLHAEYQQQFGVETPKWGN